jgi:hypothetical protein
MGNAAEGVDVASADGVAILRAAVGGDIAGLCAMVSTMTTEERCWAIISLAGLAQGLLDEVAAHRGETAVVLLDGAVRHWLRGPVL